MNTLKYGTVKVGARVDNEPPYLVRKVVEYYDVYNPKYGNDRICTCGHTYDRHFDSYEDMANIGCKYCTCDDFREKRKDG